MFAFAAPAPCGTATHLCSVERVALPLELTLVSEPARLAHALPRRSACTMAAARMARPSRALVLTGRAPIALHAAA